MAIKNMQLDPNAVTTNPAEGEYKVVAIQVNNAGKLDVEYDVPKWSGLGIQTYTTSDNVFELSPFFSDWIDELLANGFTQIRMDLQWWDYEPVLTLSKSGVTIAVGKGADVIWGVIGYELTTANWNDHRLAVLDAAQWAQDNGVFEFQLGNEDERHIDGTTLTKAQLIANLKSLATEVQIIFTNGNISYSCWAGDNSIYDWIAAGKGDIDILASNIYMGGTTFGEEWKTHITDLVAAFGVSGTYLTEFAPSWSSLDDYSTDEAVQAAGVTEMIEYIKASGMTRAIWFNYYDDSRPYGVQGFGALKTDKTYRQLWNSLLNSG